MRNNALRYKKVAEVIFDDFVCTPDGGLDYHPYLTTHLNGPDWERIYEGIAFANRLGAVLNVHVTIAWERAGICGDDRVSDALVRWAGGFRKWCAARHRPCYYVYVHERSRDHGLHTHLLTSVPQQDKQDLRGWSFNYLRRVAGSAQLPSSAICVRHRGDRDVARQWLWFGYVMKGLSPKVTIHSGRDRAFRYWLSQMATFRLRPSGIVRCRFRAGVSRNIDWGARQGYGNCGFASRFVRGATTPAELFTDAYLREFENEAQLAAMEATHRAMCPPGFSLSSL